jgi:hypothetical protein
MNTQQIRTESKNNAFSALTLFNINACSRNEHVWMNWNVVNARYNGIVKNITYAISLTNICLSRIKIFAILET